MKLWEVQVVIPPSGKERKGWVHYVVAVGEHVDEAIAHVKAEHAWMFVGGHTRATPRPYEEKTITTTRSGRCNW